MRRQHLFRLSSVALAVGSPALAVGAAYAAPPSTVALETSVLLDSLAPGHRFDTISVRSDTDMIRSFTIRFPSGARGGVPHWTTDERAFRSSVFSGDQGHIFASHPLVVRAGAPRPHGRVTMTAGDGSGVHVWFYPGDPPRLRVAGLPPDTHLVELATVGLAAGILRVTAPCRHHLVTYRAAFTVHLGRSVRHHRLKVGFACGLPLVK